jgi:hypothetical protein
MVDRIEPGRISIEHAVRRGVKFLDAANAKEDATAPSGRKDATSSGDGVAEIVQMQFDLHVAGIIRDGLDNFRSLPPQSEAGPLIEDGFDNFRGAQPTTPEEKTSI